MTPHNVNPPPSCVICNQSVLPNEPDHITQHPAQTRSLVAHASCLGQQLYRQMASIMPEPFHLYSDHLFNGAAAQADTISPYLRLGFLTEQIEQGHTHERATKHLATSAMNTDLALQTNNPWLKVNTLKALSLELPASTAPANAAIFRRMALHLENAEAAGLGNCVGIFEHPNHEAGFFANKTMLAMLVLRNAPKETESWQLMARMLPDDNPVAGLQHIWGKQGDKHGLPSVISKHYCNMRAQQLNTKEA